MTATDPEAREAMRARIVETLGEHAEDYPSGCACETYRPDSRDVFAHRDEHRTHLADVLLGLWDGDES